MTTPRLTDTLALTLALAVEVATAATDNDNAGAEWEAQDRAAGQYDGDPAWVEVHTPRMAKSRVKSAIIVTGCEPLQVRDGRATACLPGWEAIARGSRMAKRTANAARGVLNAYGFTAYPVHC